MTVPAITLRLVAVWPPIVVDWKNARLSQPAKAGQQTGQGA